MSEPQSTFSSTAFDLVELIFRVEYLSDDDETRSRSLYLPTALTKGIANEQDSRPRTRIIPPLSHLVDIPLFSSTTDPVNKYHRNGYCPGCQIGATTQSRGSDCTTANETQALR